MSFAVISWNGKTQVRGFFRPQAKLFRINIFGLSVGIAEIKHVDDEGVFDAFHNDVLEHDIVDRLIPPSPARLDAQPPVGFPENAFGDAHIFGAAADFTSENDGSVPPFPSDSS